MWALPGGHLEHGETISECARRELKEELGIEALQFKLISVAENISEQSHYIHMSFLLEKFVGEIENKEPNKCYE